MRKFCLLQEANVNVVFAVQLLATDPVSVQNASARFCFTLFSQVALPYLAMKEIMVFGRLVGERSLLGGGDRCEKTDQLSVGRFSRR